MAQAMSTIAQVAVPVSQAAMQFSSGRAQKSEANFNAGLYESQARQIDVQKHIEATQYERQKRKLAGATLSRVAKSGIAFSGSPVAVLTTSLTQMDMDKQIGQYNFEMDKQYALATGQAYRRAGDIYARQGQMNAFSTLLKGGFDYGMNAGLFTPKPKVPMAGGGTTAVYKAPLFNTFSK